MAGRRGYPEPVNPDELSSTIVGVLTELTDEGAVVLPGGVPGSAIVERPGNEGHGDYATSVALQLAAPAGLAPRDLAGLVAARLRGRAGVAEVDVAGPGFLNVTVEAAARERVAVDIVAAGPAYGRTIDGHLLNSDREPVITLGRTGAAVGMDDLIARIGRDAARYALARHSGSSPIVIDLGLWERADDDNPVYRVQYVAARTASILANAAVLGLRPTSRGVESARLTAPVAGALLGALAGFPRVVDSAAQLREPHRVVRYLEGTAADFHRFADSCRVLPMGDERPDEGHRARLLLVAATRVVFANGLGLLGVTAPERM